LSELAGHIKSDVALTHPQDGDEVTVSNVLGNVSFKCEVSTPHTLDELSQLMAKAKTENKKVKAAGGFFAFSFVHIYVLLDRTVPSFLYFSLGLRAKRQAI
jgi:hypothetical protein